MKIEKELDPLEFLKSIRSRFVTTVNSQIATGGKDVFLLRSGIDKQTVFLINRAIEAVKATEIDVSENSA